MEQRNQRLGTCDRPIVREIGPALALTLQGRKRDVAMEIPLDELKASDGMAKLLGKLKEVFDVKSTDKAFDAYVSLEAFKRDLSQSMGNYILDFERLYS